MLHPFWKQLRRKNPVRKDWHAELPSEKSQAFAYAVGQARPAYVIFSMALDEALLLRRSGKHELSRDLAEVSAALCVRFATALECILNVVERHADNFGSLPSVTPLDPLFFVGDTARRAAAMNSLLSTVYFRQRNCFLHKVRTLGEIASSIAEEYSAMTSAVSDGSASSEGWEYLSSLQFDLTTSLSESTVVLKSFIVSLPPGEVGTFCDRLATALSTSQAVPAVTRRLAPAFRRQ